MNSSEHQAKILRVLRSKDQAKRSYDRLSGFYDYFAGIFEKKHRNSALERMHIAEGEKVLEFGFGTGHCLKQIAEKVGETGKAYGIDISSGMLEVTRKRLEKAGLIDRVELYRVDAMEMPLDENTCDAVFGSFTLELFDTPEIPALLHEIKRVLKPKGRLGIVSMSKENGGSLLIKLYEWIHERFPKYTDCRPIYVEQSLKDAGFTVKQKEKEKLFGLPLEIVVAEKMADSNA